MAEFLSLLLCRRRAQVASGRAIPPDRSTVCQMRATYCWGTGKQRGLTGLSLPCGDSRGVASGKSPRVPFCSLSPTLTSGALFSDVVMYSSEAVCVRVAVPSGSISFHRSSACFDRNPQLISQTVRVSHFIDFDFGVWKADINRWRAERDALLFRVYLLRVCKAVLNMAVRAFSLAGHLNMKTGGNKGTTTSDRSYSVLLFALLALNPSMNCAKQRVS